MVRATLGEVADDVGIPFGVARGVFHDIQGAIAGVRLAADLVNDRAPGHQNAQRAVEDAAHRAANYVRSRWGQPELLQRDLQNWAARKNRDLNPDATPMGPTIADELLRRFKIGLNEGEVASNFLPAVGELKGAVELGRFAKAGPAKYQKMGATPEQAAYLAERAPGTGHHSVIPQRAKKVRQIPAIQKAAKAVGMPQLPQRVFGDLAVPQRLMDSRFNVVRPNVERGMMYRRHFGLDDHYYGGRVSADFGGGGWSGRKLGWRKYGPAERLWYGTPGALKAGLLGPLAGFAAFGQLPEYEGP
jgi:hypothetical protein